MSSKEELQALRQNVDQVDTGIIDLFERRMELSEQIAQVKAAGNIAVLDRAREREALEAAAASVRAENRSDTIALMRTLIALSRLRQLQKLSLVSPVTLPPSAPPKTGMATVAYQGVSGAWSEHGAQRLFPDGQLVRRDYFEDVFEAVKSGQADFGVLPIENSQTGAIGEVYDLLRRYACYITGEVWVAIAQCLLVRKGTALKDIREVYSHPEGFSQCRRYLKNKNWELTACHNTAYAAQTVTRQKSSRYAAIGSRKAAEAHDLEVLVPDIMDNPNNRTRFIAIAAQPFYDETCSATSITFSTAHKSGALCSVLQSFMLAGINLSRIESRPVSSDHYRFFADLEANVLQDETREALEQAAMQCDYFEILGCYPAASPKQEGEDA
jgi:chorismate mutase/prephenate dehydratase